MSKPIIMTFRDVWDAEARKRYGEHLRHLAAHEGEFELEVDEFGRCKACVRIGRFARADLMFIER